MNNIAGSRLKKFQSKVLSTLNISATLNFILELFLGII